MVQNTTNKIEDITNNSIVTRKDGLISSDFANKELGLKEIFQIERDHYKIIEYPLIIQFIIIGGITLLSSNDLITIFL